MPDVDIGSWLSAFARLVCCFDGLGVKHFRCSFSDSDSWVATLFAHDTLAMCPLWQLRLTAICLAEFWPFYCFDLMQ